MSTITKCLLCNENSEKSLCDDCSSKKRCKECNKLKKGSKADFYIYKNGKMYSTCKECYNKKVRCEICNKELNKRYLRFHIKRCNNNMTNNMTNNNHAMASVNQGTTPADPAIATTAEIHDSNNKCNRTLIVGPSFCGKTHLLLNKLRLITLEDPDRRIYIITTSLEQYEDIDISGVSVEENVEDLDMYWGCCVVIDDMLDSNQK